MGVLWNSCGSIVGCCEVILDMLCKGFEKVVIGGVVGEIMGAVLEGCGDIVKGL